MENKKMIYEENIDGEKIVVNTCDYSKKGQGSYTDLIDYLRFKYKNNKMYLAKLLDKNINNKSANKIIDTFNIIFMYKIHKIDNKVYYAYNKNDNFYINKYKMFSYHGGAEYLKDFDLKSYEKSDICKYGVELELDLHNNISFDLRKMLVDRIGGVNTSDCTVDLEFVTTAKSLQYWLDLKDNLDKVFKELKEKYGMYNKSGRNSAGGHIHIDRVNDEQAKRVVLIVEKFKKELKQLSRRKQDDFGWSTWWSDYYNFEIDEEKLNRIINNCCQHAVAVNFQHSKTIELRFFKGYTNTEDLLASIQIAHNIDMLARKNTPLKNIQIKNIIKGKYASRLAQRVGLLLA